MYRFTDLYKICSINISIYYVYNIDLKIFNTFLDCALWQQVLNMITISSYYKVIFEDATRKIIIMLFFILTLFWILRICSNFSMCILYCFMNHRLLELEGHFQSSNPFKGDFVWNHFSGVRKYFNGHLWRGSTRI